MTGEPPLTAGEIFLHTTGQGYQRGYDDGLQEGERRGWEAAIEAAAELVMRRIDETSPKLTRAGAQLVADDICKLKKP